MSEPAPGASNDRTDQGKDGVPSDDSPWTRWAFGALLVLTAVAYLWDVDRNGWANSFYAAAVQSGTHSWRSFFFGSFDWGDHITVDKPPVSLWIMALSGRIFGFSSWSMLAPQALLGVGSVALLAAAVRRAWGARAGLIAGALLAATPAAALMFRFNNPDAALTFLLVAAAYALTRAVQRGGTGWLLATAVLLGTAFLAKSLQAAPVVPGLALAYLACAPGRAARRIGQLLAAGVVLLVSGLWWPLLVDAIPGGSRPYIGGSTANSVMELILGYNGLGRITGVENGPGGSPPGAGPVGGSGEGGPGGGFGGTVGWNRLFNTEFGGFLAWWLPAAALGLIAAGWLLRSGRPAFRRTDPRLASLIVWGTWTVVTAAVFSFAKGIVHSYYTVALAPGVAALAGMALPALWQRRTEIVARGFLSAITAATALTTFLLLRRTPDWVPWLSGVLLAVGLAAAGLLLGRGSGALTRRLGAVAGVAALAAGTIGPLVWSVATIGTTHTGSIPVVGPAAAVRQRAGFPPGPAAFRPEGGPLPGGPGEVPGANTVNMALVRLLTTGAAGYRWVAASPSAMTAGPVQLAVNAPVMSLGGFNGGDDAITLDRFKALVAAHQVHYFIEDAGGGRAGGGFRGGGGMPGARGATSAISSWVSSAFETTAVGSATVYDLTKPLAPPS